MDAIANSEFYFPKIPKSGKNYLQKLGQNYVRSKT